MNQQTKKLYFVEEILLPSEDRPNYSLCLMEADYVDNSEGPEFRNIDVQNLDMVGLHKTISEGSYVFYDGLKFANGNGTSFARTQRLLNGHYRSLLKNIQKPYGFEDFSSSVEHVYSYHVYVGHGNCTILVIQTATDLKIWMIDCSIRERVYGKNYLSNIQECIESIKDRFSIETFHIDKILLTHAHYDHYSGFVDLIDSGFISQKTVGFINLNYSMASKFYTEFLKALYGLRINIVDPVSTSSNTVMKIIYPHRLISKSLVSKVNNASVLCEINMMDKKMLFTGDLEQEGWQSVPNYAFQNISYYCISHHGSINGMPVMNGAEKNSTWAILMGRNNAYNGIYSKSVIDYFRHNLLYLEYPVNATKFKCLDWSDDSVKSY